MSRVMHGSRFPFAPGMPGETACRDKTCALGSPGAFGCLTSPLTKGHFWIGFLKKKGFLL